ncbi:hypothetical protein Tco_0800431 [Tanacetum coccineum]|uniref:Uncharacterized protein n=1 Tax=Tanacetum coccineum TaxID=301880 RepID=A0ABQ4ZT28_9ASTR
MYGPCLPCGKCSRLQRRLQVATKAATKVVGGCEDCHIGCRLLRRLPHKLQAATKVACCCDGCNRACWLLRRLPQRLLQRLHATVMDAIELAGCCEGCHKGCRYSEGCNRDCWLLRRLSQRLQVAAKAATYKRQLQRSWQRSWVAVIEIMPIDQASNLVEGSGSEEKGPSKGLSKLGEGASKLKRRVLRTRQRLDSSLEIRPYAVLVEVNTAYWRHIYAVSSLTDTAYRLSEQYLKISSFKIQMRAF